MKCKQPIKNTLASVAILLLCLSTADAQQTAQKFLQETRYLLSLPEGYFTDTAKRWPLMVFLHGSGDSGNDIEKVKTHGPPKLIAAGKKFPFIVLSPQATAAFGWETENLYHLLSYIKQTYRVDNERVYLTGLSMGGYGTWELALKYPQEFAAIIPICGGSDTSEAWKLRHIPVWCFHGALDNAVPVAEAQKMVTAVKKYNPSVKFTIYPDVGHNSWERAYDNDSIYQWLLAQKKFSYTQVNIIPSLLKKYTGKYVNSEKDTVIILLENDSLKAKIPKREFPLQPMGDHLFFIAGQLPAEVRFIFNAKGKVDSFLVLTTRKIEFRKI